MIGVRSITYLMPETYDSSCIDTILKISRKWSSKYSLIRTQRVAFTPIKEPTEIRYFSMISNMCDVSDIRWFNIPIDPWECSNRENLFKFAENVISTYGRAFVNILTFKDGKMDFDIVDKSCSLIKKVASFSNNGKDNFRLGLSVNIEENGPFFPFSYSGGKFGFSIALELTQEINRLCTCYRTESLYELQRLIRESILKQIQEIDRKAHEIQEQYGISFLGFDFSIAPIISPDGSVISIIQRLGVYNFGRTGTMFATAYLTDLIKSYTTEFKSVGFSGVMYSLLEDLELCAINNQRGVSLDDLVKVSTMCGCGVDMVPVPYDVSLNELIAISMDIYAISTSVLT